MITSLNTVLAIRISPCSSSQSMSQQNVGCCVLQKSQNEFVEFCAMSTVFVCRTVCVVDVTVLARALFFLTRCVAARQRPYFCAERLQLPLDYPSHAPGRGVATPT
jgi:hypothetical protein